MKNLLLVVGLIALIPAIYFLITYLNKDGSTNLILTLLLFLLSLICLAVYFFKKFREEGEQEISITKF